MGGATPSQVVLDSIRKVAEQAMKSKSVSSVFHSLSYSSYFQVPALSALDDGVCLVS